MKLKILLYISVIFFGISTSNIALGNNQENKYFTTETINLQTYPNPVTNKITIKFSNNLKQQVHKLEIVNIIGKKLREQQILDKNTSEVSFNDLEDIPQGIYLVIARDEYGKIIQSNKFIVNK